MVFRRNEEGFMKKRILILVCALTLLVGCLALSALAADTKTGYCEACKQTVTWEALPTSAVTVTSGHKHYYATADSDKHKQIIAQGGGNLCIDLNGKQLTFIGGRAFLAYNGTASVTTTLSIQDSVGGATVTSYSVTDGESDYEKTNNGAGGVMWADEYTTLNVYGGTYTLDIKTPTPRTTSGGIAVVYPGGTMNVYGGVFNGAALASSGTYGACINVISDATYGGGQLNLYGGTFTGGNAATGKCINIMSVDCSMSVGGDAWVEEILLPAITPDKFTVNSAFTGVANITYKSGVTVAANTAVGKVAEGISVAEDSLRCTSGFSVVVDGTSLKTAEPSTASKTYKCPKCDKEVTWEAFTTTAPSTSGTYHVYMNKFYGTSATKQYHVKGGAKVCLDLNGFSYSTSGRAIFVEDSGTTLTVLDTRGGGYICGSTGGNNTGGGTVYVGSGAAFNLYSGTLKFNKVDSSSYKGVGRGAVIQSSGTINVYGGKILGGELVVSGYDFGAINGYGGAIYNGGTLNVYGGEITSGTVPESGAAPCVYMAGTGTKIYLSGDAKIEDIYFTNATASRLNITGTYTGTANLSYDPGVTLDEDTAIGVLADGADAEDAVITCGNAQVMAVGDKLMVTDYTPGTSVVVNGEGYPNVQSAIEAAQEGAVVELLKTQSGNITVDKNIVLKMNGCSLTGTVTVAEGKVLYGMDSATDDFTVADGKYGKIANLSGKAAGVTLDMGLTQHNYIAVTEGTGVSFHCVSLDIYAMSLRTSAKDSTPGLYYKSHFKADEVAAPQLATFGIALNVKEAPNAENMGKGSHFSTFTGFESGPYGNLGNATSTLLKGILRTSNTVAKNESNMNVSVYGRAYAKTADGQYLFGRCVSRSMKEQLEGVNDIVDDLSSAQIKTVTNIYYRYKSVLENKGLDKIHAAWESEEKGTLKILVLGNSHGLDATNLLPEVFYQERKAGNHDQDVLIAALYYGGCKVSQHHSFLKDNLQEYTYHKNYATQSGETWVVKDATCLDALQDEQWDIILMQQMNTNAGNESDYKAADWKFVADYLLNNQDLKPTLGFHMTWANPDDYELFLNDDAPYNIRYISTYSDPTSWRKNHEKLFPDTEGKYEQDVMYAEVMRLTQKYIVNSSSWLGKNYFDSRYIMNSATPIQYAQTVLGREQLNIYRDYTHVSDYGRLIVAYQWYAQLMGLEEIDAVNVDVIPANLRHKNSKYPTDPAVTGASTVDAQMKSDLIASVNWALKNPWNLPTE